MQSLAFQLAWAAITFVGAVIATVSVLTVCLLPLGLLLFLGVIAVPIASLVYGLYAAYETYYGADFRYWQVGDFVAQQMGEPKSEE
jgi:hypothetical protein